MRYRERLSWLLVIVLAWLALWGWRAYRDEHAAWESQKAAAGVNLDYLWEKASRHMDDVNEKAKGKALYQQARLKNAGNAGE